MVRFVIIILVAVVAFPAAAQRTTIEHHPVFETENQSMWKSDTSFSIDKNFVIFPEYSFKQDFSTGNYTKFGFGGMDFGADVYGRIGFGVGPFVFDVSGFKGGQIDVFYPATVVLDIPSDSTYNPGETFVIRSSFQADPDAVLNTTYPTSGTIGLKLGVELDAALAFQMCFIDCIPPISVIPPPGVTFPKPLFKQDFTFFEISNTGLTYICDDPSALFQCKTSAGLPPWTVSGGAFEGTMNIPNVATTSSIVNGKDLVAVGSDPYLAASLDVITLLGYVPGLNVITSVLTFDKPFRFFPDVTGTKRGVSFGWTLLGVKLGLPIAQSQNFSFEPRVYTRLSFPDPVDFVIHGKRDGPKAGRDTTFEFEVGDSVSVRYPCQYDFMDIHAIHRIKTNTTRNKTFDNISLNLDFEALDFHLAIDPYVIIPEICIPLPFGLDFCIPEIGFPGKGFGTGPLIDPPPISLVSMDFPPYFQSEWELGGFNVFEEPEPFRMTPRKRNVDFITTDVTCHGDSTGTIKTILLDASAPLKYEWSFGSTEANPTKVPAGLHQLKLTDMNRCESIEPVTITQPPAIDTEINNTSILCFGGSSVLTASASGGSGSLSYLWNNGESVATISKPSGTYQLTVTDASGCVGKDSISISEPLKLVSKIATAIDPSCADADDGSLTLFVEGGTAPYQYQWSNGSSQRDQQLLEGGNYTITVTDANHCVETDARTLIEPPKLEAALTKISDVSCYGGNDGILYVIVTGGTLPYTYQWYDSLVTLSETSSSIAGLDRGSYSIEVIDAHACKTVKNIRVTQPSRPLQCDIVPIPGPCNAQSSGRLDMTIQGGTAPYRYEWSNGASSEDLTGIPAGRYEVTVTDNQDCIVRNKALLADPEPLRAVVSVSDVTCNDQRDGQITVKEIVGGLAPFNVSWSNNKTGITVEGLDAGEYTFTIIDAVGCELTETHAIAKTDVECLFIPNAFSPNNDATNDTWVIRNIQLYPDVDVKVFNKWGTKVFESKGYSAPWNGTSNGKDLEASTYYYVLDLHNGHAAYQGFVVVLR